MNKRHIFFSLAFLLFVAFTSRVAFGLYETTHPWPTYRHDQSRSGYAPGSAPNTNTTLWSWEAPSGNLRTPIIAEGIVYTASYDDVYALDETTGVELWNVDVNPSSYQISAGPTFADGRLYVGTQEGYLYCLNATNGQQIWPVPFEATATGRIETSPVVANGKVYFGTTDTSGTDWFLYAVNATTGIQIWRYTGAGDNIKASPAIAGTWIFFGCDDGRLYALNDTGNSFQFKWYYETQSDNDFLSTPCVIGDKVYVGTSNEDHSVFAVNKTSGEMIWQYMLSQYLRTANSVAVANDIVYFAPYYTSSTYSKATALNASAPPGVYQEDINDDDIRIWRTQNFPTVPLLSPAVTNDKVFFTCGRVLHALDTTNGASIWSYDFGTGEVGEPTVADGRIFITHSSTLYCFGDFYPPNTYNYQVSVLGHDYIIGLVADATAKDFDNSSLLSGMKLTYTLEANWVGPVTAMSNVTIPNEMLGGPYTVKVDGASPTTKIETPLNATHTEVHLTYPHVSHHYHGIEIVGSAVIPEFPPNMILLLLITISLIAVALTKNKLLKN